MACARLSEEASPAVGMVTRRWHCSMSALLRPRSSQPKTMATRLPSWSRGAISPAACSGVSSPRRQPPVRAVVPKVRTLGASASPSVGLTSMASSRGSPLAVARGRAFSLSHHAGLTRVRRPQPVLAQARAAMPMFSGNLVPTIMISRCRRASCEACTSILTSGETGWQGHPQAGSPCTDL